MGKPGSGGGSGTDGDGGRRWTPTRILEAVVVAGILGIAGYFTRQVSGTLEATQATLERQAETDAELVATQREIKVLVAANSHRLELLEGDVRRVESRVPPR